MKTPPSITDGGLRVLKKRLCDPCILSKPESLQDTTPCYHIDYARCRALLSLTE